MKRVIADVSKYRQYVFILIGICQGLTLHFTLPSAVKDTKKNVISSRSPCINKSLSSISVERLLHNY